MIIKKQKQNKSEKELKKTPFNDVNIGIEISEEIPQKEITSTTKKEEKEEIDLFDIENVDFTQRQERRRGSRRRGYRRIDDRNLVSRAQEESENIKKSAKDNEEDAIKMCEAILKK